MRRAADGDVKPELGFSEVGNSKIEVPEAQEVTPVGLPLLLRDGRGRWVRGQHTHWGTRGEGALRREAAALV